jgi:transposase-like protein
MSTKTQRRWTAEEKLHIPSLRSGQALKEGRQAGQAISEVCRHHQIAPGQFYAWEKQARQGALQALRNAPRGRKPADQTAPLQAEIARLRTVIAELSAENLQLKKGRWP